jgi:hypothetical protein
MKHVSNALARILGEGSGNLISLKQRELGKGTKGRWYGIPLKISRRLFLRVRVARVAPWLPASSQLALRNHCDPLWVGRIHGV